MPSSDQTLAVQQLFVDHLRGSWTAQQLLAIPEANWQIGERPMSTRDLVLTPRGEFTRIQLLTEMKQDHEEPKL